MQFDENISIQVAQKVTRKIKDRLQKELEICHGTYKTTCSWSDVKYVELRYPIPMFRTLSEQMMYKIDNIVREECLDAGIDHNHRGVSNFVNEGLRICVYSHEPRPGGYHEE